MVLWLITFNPSTGIDHACKFVVTRSDKPGVHDFSVLKKLVLPDGSILRARYAGRPTRDCLFTDPVMDGKRYEHEYRFTFSFATKLFLIAYSLRFVLVIAG
jgi:hypothetical protein